MKKTVFALSMLIFAFVLCSCQCKHQWQKATCTEAKKCSECGEIEGEPLGHDFMDATCIESKTCKQCKATEGDSLGHEWVEATCTAPKTCSVCEITEEEPLGHDFAEATCQKPKECKVCQITEGEKGTHSYVDYACKYCGAEDPKKKTNPRLSYKGGTYVIRWFSDNKTCYNVSEYFFDPEGYGTTNVVSWGAGSYYSEFSGMPYYDGNGPAYIFDGVKYYPEDGGGCGWHANYKLTDTEIIYCGFNGEVYNRFTMNGKGDLYCTYSDGSIDSLCSKGKTLLNERGNY